MSVRCVEAKCSKSSRIELKNESSWAEMNYTLNYEEPVILFKETLSDAGVAAFKQLRQGENPNLFANRV